MIKKFFKRVTIVVLLLGGIAACTKDELMRTSHPDDTYYYQEGKVVSFNRVAEKFYVLYYAHNDEKLRTELTKAGIQLDHSEDKSFFAGSCDLTGPGAKKFTKFKVKWLILVEGNYQDVELALSKHTLYWAPYYLDQRGYERRFIETFYAKVLPGTTLKQINNLAKKHGVEMLGAMSLPGWYALACTNWSKGNSLEMAALFYESGLFEHVEPDEFTTLKH
jgi:hypothetical protein